MPRLVVLVAAYNEEAYLAETIPLILSQSMRDFALILTDNGSTDGTWALLQSLTAHDPRVTLVRTAENRWGPVVANTTIPMALQAVPDAQWLLAHGADDRMEPCYLEAILAAADRHPGTNCIFSPWQWIDHPALGTKRFPVFDRMSCHAVHMIPAWRAITPALWHAVGPENESIRIGADWEWPVRARYHLRPVQLERPYISLRVRDQGRVSQSDEVDWPRLHKHLCEITGVQPPAWARNREPYAMVAHDQLAASGQNE